MKLYSYQEEGVKWMAQRPASLLADQMGLGKTCQVIKTIDFWIDAGWLKDPKILIVCPASLKTNWRNEWEKWCSNQQLSVDTASSRGFPLSDVAIVNYDILTKPIVQKHITKRVWDVIVLDEAHKIKNPKAQRTKAVRAIKAKVKIALTGTPIENKPIELWPVLDYLQPGQWHDRHNFGCRYAGAYNGKWGWNYDGHSNEKVLQDRLYNLMLRRTKAEVLPDLPKKNRQIVELNGKSNVMYSVKESDNFKYLVDRLEGGNTVPFESMSEVRKQMAESKIDAVIEHLEQAIASSGKVVCGCHHIEVARRIRDHFNGCSVMVTGQTSLKSRDGAIECFQNHSDCKLFIGNIKAAGVGINLTAASHVVMAELSWVPSDMLQFEDRCHRIGSTGESVLIQYLVLADSLETHMAKTMVKKMNVIDSIMTTELERMLS